MMRSPESAKPVPPAISIVVPCFNEEAVLFNTFSRLSRLLERQCAAGKIAERSNIVLVDDGSRDRTWEIIDAWVRIGEPVIGVKLSRNCGHQNALLAGLASAKGDAVITIDADLQDDETAIERMIDAFQEGSEVVYGVRSKRDSDTWFKRSTAHAFYKLMNALGVQTIADHADYRLLSQRAIRYLGQFGEANMFLRGVVPLLGLKSAVVHYERRPRLAGESKYPLVKMIEFALNGITSFSVKPLRLITALGFSVCFACLALAGWALAVKLMSPDAVPGWASTILPIYFLGGVQLFCIGVLGEYTGKIYVESKKRPRYFVERVARQARGDRPGTGSGVPAHRRMRSRPHPLGVRLQQ
ncbi:glycosyltransferase family 2 protein [Ramlibacter solisilvae]|uniref:glycosyltransferase family 2 protein n=1 Tax=Ramlibacter tataouinensis TaxID=94132 RepID=UPI001D12F3E4|nr:glycosyltransferase family 2 protein [Ramlibacter tataouinensis]